MLLGCILVTLDLRHSLTGFSFLQERNGKNKVVIDPVLSELQFLSMLSQLRHNASS